MTYLLDVNALLALGFQQHEFHTSVACWVKLLPRDDVLSTCAITELGFVRVLAQAPQFRIQVEHGCALLRKLKESPVRRFCFINDGSGVERLPSWVATARQTTDGHLLALAEEHSAQLATLDQRIPGAFQIPMHEE